MAPTSRTAEDRASTARKAAAKYFGTGDMAGILSGTN